MKTQIIATLFTKGGGSYLPFATEKSSGWKEEVRSFINSKLALSTECTHAVIMECGINGSESITVKL